MNKLQQAAADYGEHNPNAREGVMQERAFLAGAAYSDGSFAEWVSDNGWGRIADKWMRFNGEEVTTAELIAIWKE